MPIETVIFDAYGTLFDVAAAARVAATEAGGEPLAEAWPALSADWRARQLSYTWLRTIAGAHADFWAVTGDALDWALERHGLAGQPDLRARLMALYRELNAYPEVRDTLEALQEAGIATGILSNGTPEMLQAAVAHAGIGHLLDHVLSVESVGIYKPAPATYALVGRAFGSAPGAVLFVSANGWDAAAAGAYGFRTAWVNREGAPVDRLPDRPGSVLHGLWGVPALVAEAADA
jgi:2-haloacid dehalogenase